MTDTACVRSNVGALTCDANHAAQPPATPIDKAAADAARLIRRLAGAPDRAAAPVFHLNCKYWKNRIPALA
jgi:hypothetical protein